MTHVLSCSLPFGAAIEDLQGGCVTLCQCSLFECVSLCAKCCGGAPDLSCPIKTPRCSCKLQWLAGCNHPIGAAAVCVP